MSKQKINLESIAEGFRGISSTQNDEPEVMLTQIALGVQATKTTYKEGEVFNSTGMAVLGRLDNARPFF